MSADPAAIARYRPGLLAYAYRARFPDAEDLVQTTLCRAIERRDLYIEGTLWGWLLAILRHARIDEIRRRWPTCELANADGVPTPGTPETTRYANEVLSLLTSIPPHFAGAVALSAFGWGNHAIADATGVSVNVVGQRLCRGRARIKALAAYEGILRQEPSCSGSRTRKSSRRL